MVLYFSDCQTGASPGCVAGNDANPGTEASPKRTLAGVDVNALPSGAHLVFKRGGSWNWSNIVRFARPNGTVTPITIDAYGAGDAPLIRTSALFAFEFSEWESTNVHGGYTIRNLKFDGLGTSSHAFFLRGTVDGLMIENVEITGFAIGVNSQGSHPIRHVTLRSSRLVRNHDMGILGHYSDFIFENNLVEGNNYIGGGGFSHGSYLSGGSNIVIRNNQYLRNSVVTGSTTCTGGNMTFHGQIDNALIENNTIRQDLADPGCWLMSITAGYNTAERFSNFVVRGNRLINGGNTAMAVNSAPGVLIENNVIINSQAALQSAIMLGNADFRDGTYPSGTYPNGDAADGNGIVRNNTVCRSGGATGSAVTTFAAPNTSITGTVEPTGAAATTGVCAP